MRPLLLLLLVLTAASPATSQCMPANPSFEVGGSGGAVFGGWNQFGVAYSTGDAVHGGGAAGVTGPNAGGWDVSGFWQSQDCVPGEQWNVTGHVRVPSGAPLTGSCAAIVNVEWRDAGDDLIDYDSFEAATPATTTDEWLAFAFTSSPAPAGTATCRLLVGVLQAPGAPVPAAHYDQITFTSTTPPTHDDIQWNDFPGTRTLDFAGRTWRIKGPGTYGPGPNYFSNSESVTWVDAEGLHLTIQLFGSTWVCTEVVLEEALGYGDYVFTTKGRLDLLDPQVVLGMFTWEYGPCWDPALLWWNPYNEFDIEYSRWGNPAADIGQFVAQPWDWSGNRDRFDAVFAVDEIVSTAFRWLPDRIECRAWRGGPDDEAVSVPIHAWTYSGPHIPRPEQPRVHLNLWKLPDVSPAADQEVVVTDFTFTPAGGATSVEEPGTPPPYAPGARLRAPAPNPFNPSTEIGFELTRTTAVRLTVYGLDGALVRTLVDGVLPAGEQAVVWDGRDDAGNRLASGVWMVNLEAGSAVETRSVVLVK